MIFFFFFFALHLILSSYFDVVVTRTRPSNVVNSRYSASPSNFPLGTSLVKNSKFWIRKKKKKNRNYSRILNYSEMDIPTLTVPKVWGSILGPIKSNALSSTARHCCNVFSELRCPALSFGGGHRHSLHASA